MENKSLEFIDLIDTKGRATHFSIHGRKETNTLFVSGNLEHGAEIAPRTVSDALKLKNWLENWIQDNI